MQVEGADGQPCTELAEAWNGVAGFDQAAGVSNQLAVAGGAGLADTAFASTVAGSLGSRGSVVELDVHALGLA
ncbi:hypothetical protein D3C72_2271940 [compost metagenome]